MPNHYDPIEYAQQLEAAGLPRAQAEIQAQALGQVLAGCLDAGEPKILSRIETLESSLRSEINLLKWMNGLTIALVIGLYVRAWPT